MCDGPHRTSMKDRTGSVSSVPFAIITTGALALLSILIVAVLLGMNDRETIRPALDIEPNVLSTVQQGSHVELNDLSTVEELKSLFNKDQDSARVFLLLDPI